MIFFSSNLLNLSYGHLLLHLILLQSIKNWQGKGQSPGQSPCPDTFRRNAVVPLRFNEWKNCRTQQVLNQNHKPQTFISFNQCKSPASSRINRSVCHIVYNFMRMILCFYIFFKSTPALTLFFSEQVWVQHYSVSFMTSLSDLIQVEILVKFHLTHLNSKLLFQQR